MSHPSIQVLNEFRCRYPVRSHPGSDDAHEDIRLGAEHGVRLLSPAPAVDVKMGSPPAFTGDPNARNRYLWVIDQSGIPYIIEEPSPVIENNLPKHTNLTGGGDAYLGGEMWFASEEALLVSGGSGRYPPLNAVQLEEAVGVFEAFGYEVTSLGWDNEAGMAIRDWEGTES